MPDSIKQKWAKVFYKKNLLSIDDGASVHYVL